MYSTPTKRLTVLHVVGGVERAGGVMHVAMELAREGTPISEGFVWKHRDFERRQDEAFVVCKGRSRYTDLGLVPDVLGALQDVVPLVRWVRSRQNVVLHAHSRLGTIAACIASKITGCPLVIHLHGLWNRTRIYKALIKWTRAEVIFNSGKTCRHFGYDPRKSTIVMPTVNWPDHPAPRGGQPRFVVAGAFVPVKNLETILEAYARLEIANKPPLVLYGKLSNPFRKEYQDQIIEACRRDSAIVVKDHDPKWAEQLTENDIFVHAAELESFGIVILEAFARGCRCVCPSGLFVDDLIEPLRSEAVYRVEPVTVERLSQKMGEAVDAPRSAESLWRLRRAAAEEFSIENAASKISTVYQSLLSWSES